MIFLTEVSSFTRKAELLSWTKMTPNIYECASQYVCKSQMLHVDDEMNTSDLFLFTIFFLSSKFNFEKIQNDENFFGRHS